MHEIFAPFEVKEIHSESDGHWLVDGCHIHFYITNLLASDSSHPGATLIAYPPENSDIFSSTFGASFEASIRLWLSDLARIPESSPPAPLRVIALFTALLTEFTP